MSKIVLPNLVENLEKLNAQEVKIRTDSCLFINSQESLINHIQFIHASMDMLMWMHNRKNGTTLNDNLVAIAGLKIRLFNSAASTIKLLLSGYYQGAVSFIRDILEITFLLDYFTMDNSSISRWVNNQEDAEFRPVNIRSALDKRDGLSEQKRKKHYKLLSTYGSHASFEGNRLLNNQNFLSIGPFFNPIFLEGILLELAKILPHPILSCMKYESELSLEELTFKKDFFVALQAWWQSNLKVDLLDEELAELQDWFDLLRE